MALLGAACVNRREGTQQGSTNTGGHRADRGCWALTGVGSRLVSAWTLWLRLLRKEPLHPSSSSWARIPCAGSEYAMLSTHKMWSLVVLNCVQTGDVSETSWCAPFGQSQGCSVGECVSEAEVASDRVVGLTPHPTPLLCSPVFQTAPWRGGGWLQRLPAVLSTSFAGSTNNFIEVNKEHSSSWKKNLTRR